MIELIEHRLRENKDGIVVPYRVTGYRYRVFYDLSSGDLMYTMIGSGNYPARLSSPTILFLNDLIDTAMADDYDRQYE